MVALLTPTAMTDTFSKTLHSVITGVRTLEDFAGVLVGCAVEDALLCVARDYGHDYSALLKKYKAAVVRRHSSGSLSDKTQCRGMTQGGKKCNKRAQLHGYCQSHAAQMAEEAAQKRKVEAYRASASTQKTKESEHMRLVEMLSGEKCLSAACYKL